MASSSGTASLAIMETLIATRKSIDDMGRNAYKPRKMETPAAGTVEYKSCGIEGFVARAIQSASGLCEYGSYVSDLTDSGSITWCNTTTPTGLTLFPKRRRTACSQAVMKAMKDTMFSNAGDVDPLFVIVILFHFGVFSHFQRCRPLSDTYSAYPPSLNSSV